MAKGMLSLTMVLLLSAMCAVEGQSGAAAAAAAGSGGGGGGAAATAAASGGGDGGPGYIGPGYGGAGYGGSRYLPYNRYRPPQYVYNPVTSTYLPHRTSSYVFAPTDKKGNSGLFLLSGILNHAINLDALNNRNGAPNPANRYTPF